jgi:hypothetical protein
MGVVNDDHKLGKNQTSPTPNNTRMTVATSAGIALLGTPKWILSIARGFAE